MSNYKRLREKHLYDILNVSLYDYYYLKNSRGIVYSCCNFLIKKLLSKIFIIITILLDH